ncbi:MAG TPA: ABC transporter permease [Actinomycetota bacterium]|nr:ABC transporter permease [Actinomycetota bacterium]
MIEPRPFWDWGWVFEHLGLIGRQLAEHLVLTFVAVGIGLAISLPLGVLAYRRPRTYPPTTYVTGLLYTIPSLAALSLLVPFTGLSTLTAEIALVSYTLLILVRNIVAGLRGVPEDVKEAAAGMGYGRRQLLWRVELPLALPAIVAGVRIATVTTIGLVTVTALIGKGGLGRLMLGGFRNLFPEVMIPVALALTVLLSLGFDGALLLMERLLSPWTRRRVLRSAA